MRRLAVCLLLLVVLVLLVPDTDAWRRRRRRRRVNCGYNNWNNWSRCNRMCSTGTQYRRRYIYRWPCCGGWGCPSTYTWKYCGRYKNGCAQKCSEPYGTCSCYTGYWLWGKACYDVNECARSPKPCNQICTNTYGSYRCSCYYGYYLRTRTYCDRVSCGAPRKPSCPSSAYRDQFGTTCNNVYIPSCGNKYKDYCYPRCTSSYYKLATYSGGSTNFLGDYSKVKFESLSRIQCGGNKVWSSASLLSRLYCRRVNDPPTSVTLSSTTINENSPVGTLVATVGTADPQSGQTHVFTLTPGDKNTGYYLFRLSGNKLYNRWVPRLGVVGGISHSSLVLTVRSTDNGSPNMYKDVTHTIKVLNVNDPPESLALTPWSVKEDASMGTTVGTLSAFDPDIPTDKNPCSSWILRDSDNGFFSLSGNQIRVAKSLNHEAQSYHTITVICTDKQSRSVSTSKTLVIDVQDAKDPPISITLDKSNVDENSKVGALVGTLTAIDEDDEDLSISMFPLSSIFQVGATSCADVVTSTHIHRKSCTAPLTVKSPSLNWELTSWYSLTFFARDSTPAHLHKTLLVNLTINNLNEQPTAISVPTPTIPENSPGGSLISDLDVTDPDNLVTLTQRPTCALGSGGDNAYFQIGGSSPNYDLALAKDTVFDYEKKNSYSITVTCNDHGHPELSITRSFTIKVSDVNEEPTGISISMDNIAENSAIGTVLGTLSTSDPDSTPQTFTYTLLPTGGPDLPFRISGNKVVVNDTIDFETEDEYMLSIAVKDQGGLEFIDTIDVNITDVPEAPTSVSLDGNHTLPENSTEGTLVGNIIVVDQDYNQLPTCKVTKDYSSGALEVSGTGGDELVAGKRIVDFETQGSTPLKVEVTCTDTNGLSKAATFTVMITDINEPPTNITLDKNTVPENTAPYTVGQLTVVDPDVSQYHNCSVQDNPSSIANGQTPETKLFKVTKTNQLQVISPLDYEGGLDTYSVHILCSDIPTNPNETSYVIERDIPVFVINVNEAPGSPCVGATWDISEMATSGTPVTGPLMANDTEADQMLTFTLANAGSVPFYINSTTQSVFTMGGLDYETTKSYALQITVTDDGKLSQVDASASTTASPTSATYTCTVTVLDANDPHSSLDVKVMPPNPCINEHLKAGGLVATLSTTDVDAAATFTYTLMPSDSPFEVVKNTIVARAGAQDTLDFESGIHSVTLSLTSTDNHGYHVTRPLTVCIKDVNENATKICLTTNQIQENRQGMYQIGQIIIQDPDTPKRVCEPTPQAHPELGFNYSCTVQDAPFSSIIYSELFTVSSKLVLEQKKALNYEAHSSYIVTVLCSDKTHPFNTITGKFKVDVIDVNEAPQNITALASGQNMPYNQTGNTIRIAVPEQQAGVTLLTLTCNDPDYPGAQAQVTYSVSGEGVPAFMEMRGNQLFLLKSFDFEVKKTYVVNIQVTDDGRPPPALTRTVQVIISVHDTNDLPTQINLVCQNGAVFPFANTTTRPTTGMSMQPANITQPLWPSTILTHPGIAGTAEDCSIVHAATLRPGNVIGEVIPQDQDSHKWYTFALLGESAKYFTLVPFGAMFQSKYSHSALVVLAKNVDVYNFTLNNKNYDIYVDVYDVNGQQQVGHIVHIKTEDACVNGMSSCITPSSCKPSRTLGAVECSCASGSYGDGMTSGTGCVACNPGELPDANNMCKQVDECASTPCKSGQCVDGVFSFTCQCPIGWTGTLCEVNLGSCAVNAGVCQNGGTCVDTTGAYTCTCMPGFSGRDCEYKTAGCKDFPAGCDDKHAKYCALTPHHQQVESTPLCVSNDDIVHSIVTGVPIISNYITERFYHVLAAYFDEVLHNAKYALTFNDYATANLGLSSSTRARRSTAYTKLAQKEYLTQMLNVTVLKPGMLLASFVILSSNSSYAMSSAYSICPELEPVIDARCVEKDDCELLPSNFRCSIKAFSQLPEGDKADVVGYVQYYHKEENNIKPPTCSESRADGCDKTVDSGEQQKGAASSSDTAFYASNAGIAVIAVAVIALLTIVIATVYFRKSRKRIKSRFEDRRLIDDDAASLASGISGVSGGSGYPSIQTRGITGIKNPLFEGTQQSETKVNSVYDSADGMQENVPNPIYDGDEQLYEELPN